tara:strand:- start:2 stop:853 length:852 start_codon:yes stop_codon:yes gene_type:complete
MLGLGSGVIYGNRLERTGFVYDFPGVVAAFSLRRLASNAPYAIRIRETGSNNEKDIGFDSSGNLDTSAISSFCGSNDGVVTKWYDQANANHALQTDTDKQPKIYTSSAVITEGGNSRPAILGDTDDLLSLSTTLSLATEFSFSMVAETGAGSGGQRTWFGGPSPSGSSFYQRNGAFFTLTADGTTSNAYIHEYNAFSGTQGATLYHFFASDGSGNYALHVDGTSEATGTQVQTFTFNTLFANSSGTKNLAQKMQEVVFYDVSKSASRSDIQTNIESYYDIAGI